MNGVLALVTALAHAGDRAAPSIALGEALGGSRALVFVREKSANELLPAPGFPQAFSSRDRWKEFLAACAGARECGVPAIEPPEGGAPVPAFGFAADGDIVVVVLETDSKSEHTETVRALLPLLCLSLTWEKKAGLATVQEMVARRESLHAEALAESAMRLQQALTTSRYTQAALQEANEQLREQAEELEAQAAELQAQAEDLQQANAALAKARAAADEANVAKSEFLATMSHELRTPLNAINGHVQLIELGIYGPVTPKQLDALDRINRSQRHLLGLITDILNFSRMETGRIEYRMSDVRIADVMTDISPMVEHQLRSKAIRYSVELPDPAITVRADREKLQQILINLLANAAKFTEPGGAVRVTCRHADEIGIVKLQVSDTGIGIPADKLSAIFEPFVQVKSGHNRPTEGTGLGLAISRDLARGMEGELTADSDGLSTGATFTLTLALGADAQSVAPELLSANPQ